MTPKRTAVPVLLAMALTAQVYAGMTAHPVLRVETSYEATMRSAAGGRLLAVCQAKAADDWLESVYFCLSSDGGRTWTSSQFRMPPSQNLGEPFASAAVFVAPQQFLYGGITADAGKWIPIWRCVPGEIARQAEGINLDESASHRFVTSMVVGNAAGTLVYAAGHEVTGGEMLAQVWRSVDAGEHWNALCRNGALIRGLGTAQQTAPGMVLPGAQGPATVIGGTFGQMAPEPERFAKVFSASPDGTVWGAFGEKLMRIPPAGEIELFELDEKCLRIDDVRAPYPGLTMSHMLRGAALMPGHFIVSGDGTGKSTGFFAIRASRVYSGWGIPLVDEGKMMMDFLDAGTGFVAAQVKADSGAMVWRLHWRNAAPDIGAGWQTEDLTGYEILGIGALAPGKCAMLARTFDRSMLYCLRFDAGVP